MKLFEDLKYACGELSRWPGCWAICGGVAAAVYRDTPRFTADLDFVLTDHSEATAIEIAEYVTRGLALSPVAGFVTDQSGKLLSGQALVIGRRGESSRYVGIDFLLPVLPWIPQAVARAQANLLDFGFARLPTITVEDLIIAKLCAFQGNPGRITDLDDIQSIVRQQPKVDATFITAQMRQFNLKSIPELDALLGSG